MTDDNNSPSPRAPEERRRLGEGAGGEGPTLAALREAFGLPVTTLTPLNLGADASAQTFRTDTGHFVKRRTDLDPTGATLTKWLHDERIAPVIAPLPTLDGDLWAQIDGAYLFVYPFVEGRSGFDVALTNENWRDLGAALRRLHAAPPPAGIARDAFSPTERASVRRYLARAATESFADPLHAALAAFLNEHRAEIDALVDDVETRAEALAAKALSEALCHGDIHAGNVLIDDASRLLIVDWDQPVIAPKERDLMFFGGAQGWVGTTPEEEIARFFAGYGDVEIDRDALAYFRYERVVQDIAAFCDDIFGGAGDEQSLRWLKANFAPGGTLEIARQQEESGLRNSL